MYVTMVIRVLFCAMLALAVQGARADEWAPTEDDKRVVPEVAKRFLAHKDAVGGAAAYAMFSQAFRDKVPFEGWNARLVTFGKMAGAVRERRLVQITWFNDPPQAPVPGTYAALQFHGSFEHIPQHLENVILHRARGSEEFLVLRNEVDFAPPKRRPGAGKK